MVHVYQVVNNRAPSRDHRHLRNRPPWHRGFYAVIEDTGAKRLWPAGDCLLPVGVCCKSLCSHVHFKGPKKRGITESEIGSLGSVIHKLSTPQRYDESRMCFCDFHHFVSIMKHIPGKKFATDADEKPAVPSLVQTIETDISRGAMVGQRYISGC
jgi:hypothetical protein